MATKDPKGSVPPPTTLRPMVSLIANSAFLTGSLTGSSTRQLSTPASGGVCTAARGPVRCIRFVRLSSQRPIIYDTLCPT
ncbi:hypothetical protein GCM10010377_25460 [Streptomyces viridiviolaceus]|nr:hypothetical protein GCM10010377_25460 [Streptomyces viridiviolaceus]